MMRLNSVADRGDLQRERLVINVLADVDVGNYAVFRAASDGDVVYADVTDTFWFPDKHVSAGDIVVLYSKSGVQKEKPLKRGGTAHFFYWDLDRSIWHTGVDSPVLVAIEKWHSIQPE